MTDFFQYKSPDSARLRLYGFREEGGVWRYSQALLDGQFLLQVDISKEWGVKTQLIDTMTDEPYTLHLVEEATGEFVGSVREAYSAALTRIAACCFVADVFQSEQSHAVIERARTVYGDELEFLWAKLPDAAILRRKTSGKWYAVLMVVARSKFFPKAEGKAEVLDLHADPTELALIVDGKRIFPGWHMNKKHWLSILLDGSVPTEEIFELLEESWQLANK